MKSKETWKPTKYILSKRGYRASRDLQEVGRGSRFIADVLAKTYTDLLQEHARGALLDLGCGKVPLYQAYAPCVDSVTCVDWAFSLHPSPHLDYKFDLSKKIGIQDGSFDTILATDLLEHIPTPEVLWDEMVRLLKPSGKLILGVPFLYWIHEEPYDFHRYTSYRLEEFCKQRNLNVVHLEPYGGSMEVIADITAKHLAFSRLASSAHLLLSKAIIKSPIGRGIAATKTSQRFPLGYSLVAQKNVHSSFED